MKFMTIRILSHHSFFKKIGASFLLMLGVILSRSTAYGGWVDGSGGITMGTNVNGYIYDYLPIYLSDWGMSWTDWNAGMTWLVAPVGQFMGYDDDGSPLAVGDLIPLTTSSFRVVMPDGQPLLRSVNDGTELGGKVTLTEPQGDISMGIYQ